MWGVSDSYLEIIRGDHQKQTVVSHANLFNGVTTTLGWAPDTGNDDTAPFVLDGSVTVDATSNVRRTLGSLTLPSEEALWQVLDTVGGEMSVARGVVSGSGGVELVPLGIFTVDTDSIDYGPEGTIVISSAPDRWGKVQKATLPPGQRASVPGNAAWQEIQRLVEGAWNADFPFPGWASLDTATATDKVGALIWDDGDREAAILALCRDSGVETFFDGTGKAILQPVPQLTDAATPVFTIDAGSNGVLLGANRTRDRTRAYNAIILTSSSTDITFNPVVVQNTLASDPLNVNGPLGFHAIDYAGNFRNSAQAQRSGLAMLNKSVGVAKQLALSAVQNDALDAGDVILVGLPRTNVNLDRPTELHIIDTLTIPLSAAGVLEVQTRSTVPATLGS